MNDNTEKRMAGDYEITQATKFGGKEFVIGVDMQNPQGEYYLTAECESNGFACLYKNCVVSDIFAEVMEIFAERIKERAGKVVEEQKDEPKEVITRDMCYPHDYGESIVGKVVAIKPSALLPEYRSSAYQLIYPTGGNGSNANSRGSAVFFSYIYSGERDRFERRDIMGVLKPEHYPAWLGDKLAAINENANKPKEAER